MQLSKGLAAFIGVLLLALVGTLGYVIGNQAQPRPRESVPSSPLPPKPRSAKPPAAPKPIILNALGAADLETLGSGCMCRFAQGDTDFLYAGGDDFVIARPNGRQLLTPLGSEAFQRIYNEDGAFSAGDYDLKIEAIGKSESGYEVHSAPSRLTIQSGDGIGRLEGTWTCAC